MDWAYLNGTIRPFDDIRARRALNFAVDRRELVKRYTKANGAEPSCQLLPPGFPSYRRYCPYQTGSATAEYQGPDLEKARQLVRESGTAGVPIVVRAFHGAAHQVATYDGFPAYLADVLRSIGYVNVTVNDIPGDADDADYAGYQIFTNFGWNADYLGPQTFFDQFSCATTVGRRFCSPTAQTVAEQAAASAQSDPGRSLELWTQVDHMLTDEGAFVTLGHQQAGVLVSPRLRNIIVTPTTGPVLSQLWVT
jgi:peptide/nickel transport system substrate-binding protein